LRVEDVAIHVPGIDGREASILTGVIARAEIVQASIRVTLLARKLPGYRSTRRITAQALAAQFAER